MGRLNTLASEWKHLNKLGSITVYLLKYNFIANTNLSQHLITITFDIFTPNKPPNNNARIVHIPSNLSSPTP